MAQSKLAVVSTFSIAMMTAAAVVSLRGLPMMAKEQLTLFVYIAFATFIFLIPAALVSAELGSAFGDKGGGVYTWVKEAFGSRWGFVAIWLQWIQNVVWYPTVLAFSAAAIAYVVGKPQLANNGIFVGIFCIAAYWVATLITLRGVERHRVGHQLGLPLGNRASRRRDHDSGSDLDRPGQPNRPAAPRSYGLGFRHVDGGRPRPSPVFSSHCRFG